MGTIVQNIPAQALPTDPYVYAYNGSLGANPAMCVQLQKPTGWQTYTSALVTISTDASTITVSGIDLSTASVYRLVLEGYNPATDYPALKPEILNNEAALMNNYRSTSVPPYAS
jgi:hypothetical protein